MRKAISAVKLLLPLVTAGISLGQNNIPGISIVDYTTLGLPPVGGNVLHVLTPTILELKLINTKCDFIAVLKNFVEPTIWGVVRHTTDARERHREA